MKRVSDPLDQGYFHGFCPFSRFSLNQALEMRRLAQSPKPTNNIKN